MTVYPETREDCRRLLVTTAARLTDMGHRMGHCVRSCACGVCLASRMAADALKAVTEDIKIWPESKADT